MLKFRYFEPEEFSAGFCNPPCSIEDMDQSFLLKLDDARAICSVPFVINSAYRTPEYEREHSRSGTSSHCKGLAVDLRCTSAGNRLKMLLALLAVGFMRIGLYDNFIHVDFDNSKKPCIWLGK